VTEWASRAGLFSRMVSRAYPSGNAQQELLDAVRSTWDLAAQASSLEGEIASHTRRLEALERRGRALRAEIGRKVEELAHEESRALRDAAGYAEDERIARAELVTTEREAQEAGARAEEAERSGSASRALYERCGAARALVQVGRQDLKNKEA